MKRNLVFGMLIVASILLMGCETVPASNGAAVKQTDSFVYVAQGKDKMALFKDALQWAASKGLIDLKDEESGKIIGKGERDYKWTSFIGSALPHRFRFTYVIDVRDGKARIAFQDIFVSDATIFGEIVTVKWVPLHGKQTETLVWDELNAMAKSFGVSIANSHGADF